MASTSPTASKAKSHRLLVAREWDVIAPVPSNTLKAALTPKTLRLHHRERRITLETYLITSKDNQAHSYEQTIVKFLVPSRKGNSSSNASRSSDRSSILSHVTFKRPNRNSPTKSPKHITSPSKIAEISAGARERLNSDVSDLAADYGDDDGSTEHDRNGWREKYTFDLDDFILIHQNKETCIVTTTFTEKDPQRELIFRTEQEAIDFASHVTSRISLERKMKERRLINMLGHSIQDFNLRMDYVVDIVGAVGLHKTGLVKGNPFVVVKMGDTILHQTDYVENSVDPIWTIRSKSIFLLSVTVKELLIYHEKLDLFVYDYDFGAFDRILGVAIVPTADIFMSSGERKEYALGEVDVDSQIQGHRQGSIAIRCRRATENDREILKNAYSPAVLGYTNHSSNLNTKHSSTLNEIENQEETDGTGLAGNMAPFASIIEKRERALVKDGIKITQFKTRPGPDPDDKMDTEWLTNDEIQRFIYKPSTKWKEMGRGTLGTIYLEVLGCDSLPPREKNGLFGDKRDAFVQIIYGDSRSQTDVIDSCLSPRWLPWAGRAFTLHMKEQCAVIFLAVFDFDLKQSHAFIGRVAIPLVHFHPNTEYLLDYKIHRNSTSQNRPSFGTLKVRLRLEIDYPRKYLLSSIQFSSSIVLNVPGKKQFQSVLLTCYGDDWDQREYNVHCIAKAMDEIRSHFSHFSYAYEAVRDVILWRKTSTISLRSMKFRFPLQSFQLFLFGLIVLRFPRFLPSSFTALLLTFSWCMMRARCSQQNPWMRCTSIREMIRTLLFNENMSPVTITLDPSSIIQEDEPCALVKTDNDEMKSVQTTTTGIPYDDRKNKSPSKIELALDMFKPNLFTFQQELIATIEWIRLIKRILIWEEASLSFWLSLIFLIITVLLMFIPWMLVIRSLSTFFVWTFLSPFMKLVDVIFLQDNVPSVDKKSRGSWKQTLRAAILKHNLRSRMRRENEERVKDMKQSLFGSYSIRIPRFSVDLFADVPLPTSMATPYNSNPVFLADLCLKETGLDKIRDHGQQLVESIIPQIEKVFDYIAPIGQIARHKYLLALNDPAASLSSDSIVIAAVKLLSLLLLSAFTTWLTVPILKLFIEKSTGTLYKMLTQ